jgi:DNA-binding transcriptional ArsR family regulator
MNLSGKNREEIGRALARKTRAELIDIIFSLSTIEQHLKPAEIARRSGMTKRTVLADVHKGRFGGEYYKRAGNQITVSASGINAWRDSFRVIVKPNEKDSNQS